MRVNTQRGQAEPESAAAEPGSHVTPEPRPEVYSEDQPPPLVLHGRTSVGDVRVLPYCGEETETEAEAEAGV